MRISYRNIPLIFQGEAGQRPVITLENYCKWYYIFVVHHPDTVKEEIIYQVSYQLIDNIQKTTRINLLGDHVFHPYLLEKIAEYYEGYVDEVSSEVACGRWIYEYKNIDLKNI